VLELKRRKVEYVSTGKIEKGEGSVNSEMIMKLRGVSINSFLTSCRLLILVRKGFTYRTKRDRMSSTCIIDKKRERKESFLSLDTLKSVKAEILNISNPPIINEKISEKPSEWASDLTYTLNSISRMILNNFTQLTSHF